MKMLRFFFALVLYMLTAGGVLAFDSSSAYNVVTMSYPSNQTIYNRVVLDANQQSQTSLTFSVDVKNGGGRPTHDLNGNPLAYSTQTDSAFIRVKMYNTAGTLINTATSTTYILKNLGSDPSNQFSTKPGDNLQPWSNASVTYNGSLSDVWFVQIEMVGTDGAFWAGNYGPQWRAPTVSIGGDTSNVVYNPEFGISPNSVKAQGWFNSSNNWATCGVTSGNIPCVTNESGVTANMWGGGYDANGGSLASQPGGYDGTLTTSSADTAATTGTPTGGATTPPPPVYSSNITSAQATRAQSAALRQAAVNNNSVYIDQVGDNNTITITQTGNNNKVAGIGASHAKIDGNSNNITVRQGSTTGSANGKNLVEMSVVGDSNTVTINQSRNNTGVAGSLDSNNHYQTLNLQGSNNTVTTQQSDSSNSSAGHFMETTIGGNNNLVNLSQTGTGGKVLFTNVNGSDNNAAVTQKGTGDHYLDVSLTGNGNSATVVQDGAIKHRATIDLTNAGGPASITLNQNSNTTGQVYSIQQSCVTAGGCVTTVNQN